MTNRLILIFSLLISSLCGYSQVTSEILKGDKFAEEFQFGKAIYFYNLAHELDDQNPVATRRLADVYKKIGDLETSCEYLVKTLELDGAIDQDMLAYAEALKRLERYEEAIFWYNKYATVNPNDRRAQEHIRNQEYYKDLWSDSLKYRMHKMDINAELSSFGVSPIGDQYLFSSNMINPAHSTEGKDFKSPYLEIFICDEINEQFTNATPLDEAVNSKYHDGPVFYDPNSDMLYITRTNMKKGKPVKDKTGTVNLKIYTSSRVDGIWQEPVDLAFNSDEYSTGHPCLSSDGKTLFFVSNMPGGYGGTDIYKSKWQGTHWGEPINLGKNINTEGNEMFPYVSKEGIIYFASNGHAGLGGLDNFMSEPWGEQWSVAYNLGYPINTSHDDFGLLFVPGSEIGFFSSSRGGTGNDELHFFMQLEILEQLVVGRVNIDLPDHDMAGERIRVEFANRNQTITVPLDENGAFEFVIYPEDEVEVYMESDVYSERELVSYQADEELYDTRLELGDLYTRLAIDEALEGVAGLEDIISHLESKESLREQLMAIGDMGTMNTSQVDVDEFVVIDDTQLLILKDEVKDLNIDNIYFAFDSYLINRDARDILNDIVFHLNENQHWKIEIDTHTDSRGSKEYNQFLSEQRANAVRKFLLKNGIDGDRILSRAHGEEDLISACDQNTDCGEDIHSVNRRAEFRYMVETSSAPNTSFDED